MPREDQLYFRQLRSGRDFALGDPFAAQMVNFAYLVGDRAAGQALVVDPAYDVERIVAVAEADGMRVVGALASHYHADHVGGELAGHAIDGVVQLLERLPVPVHAQRAEAPLLARSTGLDAGEIVRHDGGDQVHVGDVSVTLLHTPGHTPGSQCFLVDGLLVAGDTLFLEGCGRTDLPGSDSEAMYDSLQRLATLPDDTVVYPGHQYSVPSCGTLAAVREVNQVYKPPTRAAWLAVFGR